MAKKSKKQNNKEKDNLLPFPSPTPPLKGAKLRDEYDAKESDEEEVSDEIAEFVLKQLFTKAGKEYNYKELLLGLNKAYLQLLLQLVDDSGFEPDEFLDYFYKEAEKLAKVYLIENKSEDFDPVKASGSLALASSFIFEAIDDVEEE